MDDDLREHCEFGEDRAYLLVAIARAKDNAGTRASDERVLRQVVAAPSEIPDVRTRLEGAAAAFEERFRLYVTVNARDALAAFFRLRQSMDDWLEARLHGDEGVRGKFARVGEEWASILQSDRCADDRYFLFDLDDASEADLQALRNDLRAETTVRTVRQTPNGYHVVTAPFDYTAFETDVDYELKTDGLLFVSVLGE